jgi:hypothetical protein
MGEMGEIAEIRCEILARRPAAAERSDAILAEI